MTIDITEIVVALIGLCGTITTVILVPLLKSKLTDSQMERLRSTISIWVSAAEQLSNTGAISKAARKQYVVDAVIASGILERLKRWGITINLEEVYDMIEAAVYDLPNKITNREVKSIAEVKIAAIADATVEQKVEAKVQQAVENKLPEVMENTVQQAVESAVESKLPEVVETKIQEASNSPNETPKEHDPEYNNEDKPGFMEDPN